MLLAGSERALKALMVVCFNYDTSFCRWATQIDGKYFMHVKIKTINMKGIEILCRDSGLLNSTDTAKCVAYRMHI